MTSSYDVVVVGGGINGVGMAQAVAAGGHSVLLLEKSGLAHGTSSKSSKLIHGGLRYLESYEFSMVRESLKERALLLRNAPELVKMRDFFIPVYAATRRQPLIIRAGLSLYSVLGGLSADTRFDTVARSRWEQLDGLNTTNLKTVFRYKDGQTDDSKLTRAIMKSAQSLGAELLAPAEFKSAQVQNGRVSIQFMDQGIEKNCEARLLINAGGPWVNEVVQRITPKPPSIEISLVQGAHIVVPGETTQGIYYMESRRDGRAVFVMPWGTHTMVGTTETKFVGNPDEVKPLSSERSYLSAVLAHHFPKYRNQSPEQVVEAWAGLRVLPGGSGHAFHKSRETILIADRNRKPRVLSIYGGKLTSYRSTAEKVFRRVQSSLPNRKPRADTKRLHLEPDV